MSILPENEAELDTPVELTVEMDAARDALLVCAVLCNPLITVAADDEFVATVLSSERILDLKELDALLNDELSVLIRVAREELSVVIVPCVVTIEDAKDELLV